MPVTVSVFVLSDEDSRRRGQGAALWREAKLCDAGVDLWRPNGASEGRGAAGAPAVTVVVRIVLGILAAVAYNGAKDVRRIRSGIHRARGIGAGFCERYLV